MLEALHLHVDVVCHQSWDQGHIRVLMVHRPNATGSFQILMFHVQATGVIFMKITMETETTELDHGSSSIVLVVSPQSYVSCGI